MLSLLVSGDAFQAILRAEEGDRETGHRRQRDQSGHRLTMT
jgi:hypothetical protein